MAEMLDEISAVSRIKDGDTLLSGGFLSIGTPENLVDELLRQGQKNLTVVCNDGGSKTGMGVGKLVHSSQVRKFICSWFGYTPLIGELYRKGDLELEIIPQGSLAERIRAGGFGLGGVLTPVGLGTMVEKNWGERVTLDGRDWLYHTPIRGNVAIVEAYRADEAGNLIFRRAQRNFSPVMCFAADLVIASVVSPIEPVGSFDPDEVCVPGAVVDILVPQKGVRKCGQ